MSIKDETAKVAYIVWRVKDLLRCYPWHSFQRELQSPIPDYEASLDLWSAHPDRESGVRLVEDANWLSAPNMTLQPPCQRPCDCFFVHDSCCTPAELMPFLGECAPRWNAPLRGDPRPSERQLAAKIDEQVDLRVAAAASCFSGFCRIYAPRYRQASVLSYHHIVVPPVPLPQRRGDGRKAFDLAYGDVRAAFLHMADNPLNAGRPFVIAGHSQGSQHLLRLLQDEIERRPDLLARFVHAYLAGQIVPMDVFERGLRTIRPSTQPGDLRSVSSWRTGRKGHSIRVRQQFSALKYIYYADRDRWRRSKARVLATNPVSWTSNWRQRGGAPSLPKHYKGAAWPLPENMDPRDHAGLTSCGVNCRFGHVVARSRDTLGVIVRRLSTPDVGDLNEFRARVDRLGTTIIPAMPTGSVLSLMERDWLLYHDMDFAVFHNNIRENANLRYEVWKQTTQYHESPHSRL